MTSWSYGSTSGRDLSGQHGDQHSPRSIDPSTFETHQQHTVPYGDCSTQGETRGPFSLYHGLQKYAAGKLCYDPVSMKERSGEINSYVPLKNQAKLILKDWLWEFAAAALNSASFAVVVIMLAIYGNKPLSSWNFTALLVPVASCISQLKWIHLVDSPRPLRNVQVFDDASRGPWGSLELIWKFNIKTKLATWGSVITILNLTMGPFAQQLLSYPEREVLSPGAIFYRSQTYDSGATKIRLDTSTLATKMDPKMQGAILNGLYNLSAPIHFTCPTGNCQWDEFSTLAIKGECKNVTSETKTVCTRAPIISCNYTTPSAFFMNRTGYDPNQYYVTSARKQILERKAQILNSSIVSFAMAVMSKDFNFTNPEVMECSMDWCARVIRNTTVVNGTFNLGPSKDFDLKGVPNAFQIGDMVNWDTFKISNDHNTFLGNRTFTINVNDNMNIAQFLKSALSSSITNPLGLALMNSSNLTDTIASISTGITYAMGQSPSGEKVHGQVISMEQYIHVDWPWIILPLAEVVMGIALLVCTLVLTHQRGMISWKSSGTVPLLLSMKGWDSRDLNVKSRKDMEEQAKHMWGRLISNGENMLAFKRTDK